MREKKLTDEQLIHDLEEFAKDIDMNETGIYTDILDLIHRLQAERNDMHKDLIQAEKYAEKLSIENAEQKAEIERLTEELATAKNELVNEQRYYENAYSRACQLETQNAELKGKICELVADKCNLVIKEKQAVKDTAKEIFAELFYIASIHHSDVANILSWAKEKAKSKGVEVE